MDEPLAVGDESGIVRSGWELAVELPDSARQVDDILRLIAGAGIEVLAHCCYRHYSGMRLLLVSEDVEAACVAVRAVGYKCLVNPIVRVTAAYRVGRAASLGAQLQTAGIKILYTYVAWKDGQQAVFVLKIAQDDLAVRILSAALAGRGSMRRSRERIGSAA